MAINPRAFSGVPPLNVTHTYMPAGRASGSSYPESADFKARRRKGFGLKMSHNFPSYAECPTVLRQLEGNCGPVAVWMVLRHFRKTANSQHIIRACRHTRKNGTFTIALAVALRESGLHVEFHSDRDLHQHRLEREMYRRAKTLGIAVRGALTVQKLTAALRSGRIAVVYFNADERTGHFSPLTSVRRGRLILPNTERGSMLIDEFETKWNGPDICRQCILVSP